MEITKRLEMANGNPGAMDFISKAALRSNENMSFPLFDAMDRIPLLRGTSIYILCSDLCGGDFLKIDNLCKNCPDDILSDASNRQDRSGVALVKEYL